ncbi:putative membrane protein, putative toxin regulator [Sphaerochaeta pleomorpha str. Grapes]|uniref:Putative membrane protein, putative toxin regulator n=1 Tax=Sphaerochaeta pleomorpha (strain ATCC BAA-1885 / DSM 22778 / Grapes) TaxID=158190 RepID=G8QSE2_SPHPG|nr:PTS sugar transporter subunit IIC [Sphaerochaeta pleomorpha]AEV30072.1 putative membrane protein, putative toxin regulator [Sphaerochaeta pleomorpha str. Grapes]
MSSKEFMNKILNGMSIGIVAALVPSAILGELSKALGLTTLVLLTTIAARLAVVAMGLCIAGQFKMKPIHSVALAISTLLGSGAIKQINGALVLAGMGDIINAGITAIIATLLLLWFGDRFKSYTMILVPTLTIAISGIIGLFTLPYVSMITGEVGHFIAWCTTLQPILMGALISMSFCIIIISPISTVAIALAVSLSGISSGAANLGICAAGFGLAIAGFEKNGWGTSLASVLGSPKLHMANFLKNPKMSLPLLCNALVLGILAGILGIVGTPMSAGFGISGLIGPLNHLGIVGYSFTNWMITLLVFLILPIVLGFVFKVLFFKGLKIVKAEDYAIEI